MGQYYLACNTKKMQYLSPHGAGDGAKLLEFSSSQFGMMSCLAILLAEGNGRGSGDLSTEGLSEEEKSLIGSWAGDPIHITGDYADPMVGIPKSLIGKPYYPDGKGKPSQLFGKEKAPEGEEPRRPNLYEAAHYFFEDITDRIITVIAKGDGRHGHPFATMDLSESGIRDCAPGWSVKPRVIPKKPAGGKKIFNLFMKQARSQADDLVGDINYYLNRNPEERDSLLGSILALFMKKSGEAAVKAHKDAATNTR